MSRPSWWSGEDIIRTKPTLTLSIRASYDFRSCDPNPITLYRAFQKDRDAGLTYEAVAVAHKVGRPFVNRHLALRSLDPELMEVVENLPIPLSLTSLTKVAKLPRSKQRKALEAILESLAA